MVPQGGGGVQSMPRQERQIISLCIPLSGKPVKDREKSSFVTLSMNDIPVQEHKRRKT